MPNRIRLLTAAVAMIGSSACGTDRSFAPGPQSLRPGSANTDIANLTTDPVLYSQGSTSNTTLVREDQTESAYIGDDFVVPDGQVWTVTAFVISGHVYSAVFDFSVLSDSLPDSGDRPGHVLASANVTSSDPATCCSNITDYLVKVLRGPLELSSGRYWLRGNWNSSQSPLIGWQPSSGNGSGALFSIDGGTTWQPVGAAGLSFSVVGHSRLTQSITFPAITPNPALKGTSATLGATASSNLSVTYTSLSDAVCKINGASVDFIAPGLCTVAADQGGNDQYAPADRQTQSINVNDVSPVSPQTITFVSTPPSPAYIGGTYTVNATGGGSGNPVVLAVAPSSVCATVSNIVSLIGVGTCTITANQAGNSAYTAAPQVTQTVKIGYRFDGFGDPVTNGALNVTKAGKTIPLKWRLTNASGAPITNLTSVTVTVADLSCTLGSTGNVVEESAAGNSGLQNLGNGNYQFNWKVPSSYAKSCKTLQLDLGEGSGARTAQFEFTK